MFLKGAADDGEGEHDDDNKHSEFSEGFYANFSFFYHTPHSSVLLDRREADVLIKQETVSAFLGVFIIIFITYLPRAAVGKVSNNKKLKGRRRGIQLVRKSIGFRLNRFEIQLV